MADSDSTTQGKSPAFQFYPKDFLSDENVRVMSLQERGAYITLICLCWTQGTIPCDVVRLAKLINTPAAAFRKLWPAIQVCFRPDPGNTDRMVHPRLERELMKQAEFRRRQSDKGKASGESRRRPSVQPEPNHGSTAVQPMALEPNTNSSISDLQSASSDSSQTRKERVSLHARTGGGVMAGMLPRDHLRHSWCGRVCVPDFLHGQFLQATGQTDEQLYAFYRQVFANVPDDEAVESDALKFWRPLVSAKWPPKKVGQSMHADGNTVEDLAAAIRRDQEARRERRG